MQAGDLVRLRCYAGEEVVRVVVKVNGFYVAVCKEEELAAAKKEGRDPLMVGFPITDVLGVVQPIDA